MSVAEGRCVEREGSEEEGRELKGRRRTKGRGRKKERTDIEETRDRGEGKRRY
jgi:hypothetical protein